MLLETHSLSKDFGGLRAVNQCNFSLEKGELRCLIGPNGAGKSTFFNLLLGRLKPSGGRIFFKGQDITKLDTFRICRLGISIKFQIPAVYENLTVMQNLFVPAQFRRDSHSTRQVIESILAEIGLTERSDSPAKALSHGEKQWLEIGMAMCQNPDLMLLDEPTAGMTKDEVTRTVELVEKINQTATIIVVEHDMNFIRQIAKKVTVLHQGAIFAEGSMEEISSNDQVKEIYLGKDGEKAFRQ
jgi:branched-chain amino acid transport system ATP-binding protein